jgi:hypothetical protein
MTLLPQTHFSETRRALLTAAAWVPLGGLLAWAAQADPSQAATARQVVDPPVPDVWDRSSLPDCVT